MLRSLFVLAMVVISIPVSTTLADSFPYVGFVHNQGAPIRSGPGLEFYATDRLDWGTKVDIYRHGKDGWAAIRPPEGSFSWIQAEYVELADGTSVGEVISRDAHTRVGTRYGDAHHVEYVHLKRGELIEVLGSQRLPEEPGIERHVWYKIMPPAGEFRWIRLKSIQRDPPVRQASLSDRPEVPRSIDDPSKAAVGKQPRAGTAKEGNRYEVAQAQAIQFEPLDEEPIAAVEREAGSDASIDENPALPADTARSSQEETPTKPTITGFSVPRGVAFARDSDGPPVPDTLDTPASLEASVLNAPRRSVDPGVLKQELTRIHLDLTRDVVKKPLLWQMDRVRRRTQAVIDLSPTADIRGEAQELLARITQFEDLQRRYLQLARGAAVDALGTDVDSSLYTDPGVLTEPVERTRGNGLAESRYDGTGWLMPVVARRDGVPRYALTDRNGNILQFVTPKPGLNLRSYARKQIGVMGQKGYLPALDMPHLTAERVINLDRVRY